MMTRGFLPLLAIVAATGIAALALGDRWISRRHQRWRAAIVH